MRQDDQDWIDAASYEALLRRHRFAPVGARIFKGAAGEYYHQAMRAKRVAMGEAEHTRASKAIGWEEAHEVSNH